MFHSQGFARLMQTRWFSFVVVVPWALSLREGIGGFAGQTGTVQKDAAFQKGSSGHIYVRIVSNFPSVALVIQVVLLSYIVRQTSWLFNTGFHIKSSISSISWGITS